MSKFLEIARVLTGAEWLELELRPNGGGASGRYRVGSRSGSARSVSLDIGDRFDAVLELGSESRPDPHILRAVAHALDLTLGHARISSENRMLRGAFDSTSSAVLLFSSDGDIVHANPPADDLLSLQTEDNLIIDSGPHHGQPLFEALCVLVDQVIGDSKHIRNTSTLRVVGGREMICEVVRLTSRAAADDPRAVMVILRSARGGYEVRVDAFSAAHGLSPREQEVVERLLLGMKTTEMADDLGISPHTVRDHLKHLYRKTNTGSRSELLGLLSREQPPQVDETGRA